MPSRSKSALEQQQREAAKTRRRVLSSPKKVGTATSKAKKLAEEGRDVAKSRARHLSKRYRR